VTSFTIKHEEKKMIEIEAKARQVQLSLTAGKYVLWAATISMSFTFITWLFLQQYTQLLALTAINSVVIAGTGIHLILYRRNQAIIGIYFFLTSIILTFLIVPIIAPELILIAFTGYLLIIILAYLLLGDRGGRWLSGVSISAAIVNILIIQFWSPNWFTPLEETVSWMISTFLSVLAIAAVSIILRNIIVGQAEIFHQLSLVNEKAEKRTKQLELAKLEIENRVATEQEQHEYLQTTINGYIEYIIQVAEGNLSTRLDLQENGQGPDDPLLVLGNNLNNMVDRLSKMTSQIHEATINITTAATEILAATTQQAAGANEQSAAISQTTTTIDEVKTIVDQSFRKAQAVAEQAQRTSEVSQAGQQTVSYAVESINQIKDKVEGIAENILALSEQTQQIGDITATVDDIASQSNLLALNASVEAARAGEHGKGFAVVAVEVRNLAEQSKQATAQVKSILNEIQRATNAAVMATEEGTKGVDSGVQLTGQTGETITQLTQSITESANAAQQIVASAQQQTTGIEQISLAMENIHQATIQSLTSTRQAEKAAQDLSNLAQQMKGLVAQYKLN
jgi:methyl-accepting chemotaxis protein